MTIDFERPDSEQAVSLIRQLDDELCRRYPDMPPQLIHGLHPSDLADPKFAFLVARIDGSAVGCGALRTLGPDVGEVKRMFVLPDFRGHGIARRILAALEARAVELGYATVRLETGKAQPEAVCLYTSSGYREIPGFGEYADNGYSVCFEKQLL
jgi:GNAT superfamily N-acetyltransferase